MWDHLNPNDANLESIFEPLLKKAIEFGRLWSIAELNLTKGDIQWLRRWFFSLKGNTELNGMFGAALLCLGSEICREEGNEGSVWPEIRNIFPSSHPIRNDLFLTNGQPSYIAKELITIASRILNLRNAMDIEGTQQWFVTIKLQYGFTYAGAKSRLAEWLVGLSTPTSVSYLNGDSDMPELYSDSFCSLWKALKQYRQGYINSNEVREVLQTNPWIKSHWINDLLIEAKARIDTLGSGELIGVNEGPYEDRNEEAVSPISEILLEWNRSNPPRLKFLLNRENILKEIDTMNATEHDFHVDGKGIRRWLKQKDGSWAGETCIAAEPDDQYQYRKCPNLSPQIITIHTGSGEILKEWDLGLSNEMLIFDIERGGILTVGDERLDRNRKYAIVCDRLCEIQGCVPEATFERNGLARKVLRLPTPLDQNILLAYRDFVIWQPITPENRKQPNFNIKVTTTPPPKIYSFDDRTFLVIEGLPEDAKDVKLLIHRTIYETVRDHTEFYTSKNITLTPDLAAKRRRIRVRFSHDGHFYTIDPQLSLSIVGAAVVRYKQEGSDEELSFEQLKSGSELNRIEGSTCLRIWVPSEKHSAAFEGDCKISKIRNSKIRLYDIPGHGGELHIILDDKRINLGIRCKDTGCVNKYIPSLMGNPAQIYFTQDKPINKASKDGYNIYEWIPGPKYKATLHALPFSSILPNSNERIWQINCSPTMMALAFTRKGYWLGGWCDINRIQSYISTQNNLPEHDFAILKWLRVPVLHPDLEPYIKSAVMQYPARFIKSWMKSDGLPEGIHPHEYILGCDSVVRHFLWPKFPAGLYKEVIEDVGLCKNRFDNKNCIDHLERLNNISLPLFGKGIKECQRKCPKQSECLFKNYFYSSLGIREDAKSQLINYRLQGLKKRILIATGISEERTEELITNYAQSSEQCLNIRDQDLIDILWIGQTYSGRKYLASQIIRNCYI